MANATVGTLNNLVENGFLADPVGDTLDTGTAAVQIPYDVSGKSSNVFFRVNNTSAVNHTFSIALGTYPPAMKAGIAAPVFAALAAGTIGFYGPFDSSQFMQGAGANAGKILVTVTPASGTITAKVTAFRVPTAS